MNVHRAPDKAYCQMTPQEINAVSVRPANPRRRPPRRFAVNDLEVCRAIVGRLDEAKSITKAQLANLRDIAGRMQLDTSRLDFPTTGVFEPGSGSPELIERHARTKTHVGKAIQAHLACRAAAPRIPIACMPPFSGRGYSID
jgi:hypothetical protein